MQIHKLLLKKGKTIAVAESCTSGLLAKLLTEPSGSSRYFIAGIIAYSNRAKTELLGVPASLLSKKGAVSKVTALTMARRIRKIAHTDIGIGITGIAGPAGGTPLKPVGTVFIALADGRNDLCKKFLFKGTRNSVRQDAALQALILLQRSL